MSEIRVSPDVAAVLAGPVLALATAADDLGRASGAVPPDATGATALAAAVDAFRIEVRGRAELLARDLEGLQRDLSAAVQRYELVEQRVAVAAGGSR